MLSHHSRSFGIRFISAVAPFLFINGFPFLACADKVSTEEWNISADKVTRFDNPSSVVAEGNVVLVKKAKVPPQTHKETSLTSWSSLLGDSDEDTEVVADQVEVIGQPQYKTEVTIRADWIVYDVEMKMIKAKGHVFIDDPENELNANEGSMNLNTETGSFKDATIKKKDSTLHLEGEHVEKTGYNTYKISDGWVITCKLENGQTPPWSLAATKTNITQGGYAVLKNARFNIKNVPVLYSPYLIVPVKDTRQTGFLMPEFSGSSKKGFGVDLPLFINLSDSTDITLFPEFYTKRGAMPGLEFRYVASETSKGMFSASYLDDQLSDPSETEYYEDTGFTHDNSDRYWIRGKMDHDSGEWQTRLDIDVVSDQDYFAEFDAGSMGYESSYNQYLNTFGRGFENDTDTQRENTLSVLRSWGDMSLQANLIAINDAYTTASDTSTTETETTITDTTEEELLAESEATTETTPLWTLPSVDFNGAVPIGESAFSLDWDTNYINYWREEGIGGQRIDLRPALSAPINLGAYLESRAEVALRDTFYSVNEYGDATWENDTTQNRFLPEFFTEVATTLEKDFYKDGATTRSYAHQVRPYVQYDYIPDTDQDELPYFDDKDFIDSANSITYGVDNFLNFFSTDAQGEEDEREYGYFKISQAFDLRDESSDEPFEPIVAKIGWSPADLTSINYKNEFDVYTGDFTAHTLGVAVDNANGDYLYLDYSQKEAEDIDQINAEAQKRVLNEWYIGGKIEHSLAADETERAKGYLKYQAPCWSVKFQTNYRPSDTTYLVVFNLANIGMPIGASL